MKRKVVFKSESQVIHLKDIKDTEEYIYIFNNDGTLYILTSLDTHETEHNVCGFLELDEYLKKGSSRKALFASRTVQEAIRRATQCVHEVYQLDTAKEIFDFIN